MKKVVRRPLGKTTREHLKSRQDKVNAENGLEAQAKRAVSLWDQKKGSKAGKKAFSDVEKKLVEMCNAPRRCMYCEDSEARHIEHVKPKSKYPQNAFEWENYLLACATCNVDFKKDKYHPDFMNPSAQDFNLWQRWQFDPVSGHYLVVDENDEGAAETLRILGFDERSELAERRVARLEDLVVGIMEYGKARLKEQGEEARRIASRFRVSFPAIAEWVLVQDPPPALFPAMVTVRKVKEKFPDIVDDAGL